MHKYEPYLESEKAKKSDEKKTARAEEEKARKAEESAETDVAARGDAGAAAPKKSWWQREDADDKLHEVRLEALAEEEDDVLKQRMVKGFYIAVDRVFRWNDRSWYKTTKGFVAPTDRFWETKGSEFQGVKLLEAEVKLPVGWVYGWQKERPKYEIDEATKKVKSSGVVKHFALIDLNGKEITIGKNDYVQAEEGYWVRKAHLRITEPGEVPEDITADERWVDVDLSSQTVVAFVGKTPVYTTMISSGKESKIKEKDHSTPRGKWRIREKHVTTTMDGDGSAAGDLPYSIEDVPYVMYFHKAYALHGAFWHRNYGVRMSHGCVNLAPLDAKYFFLFTTPYLPEGWHGGWSSEDRPGSWVVVHD
jgi:lipoprotein-anchoring transpeptidase ErfK/SrfK